MNSVSRGLIDATKASSLPLGGRPASDAIGLVAPGLTEDELVLVGRWGRRVGERRWSSLGAGGQALRWSPALSHGRVFLVRVRLAWGASSTQR